MRINQTGFSLIEVLVTMVVMAVWLLGLAVLQLKSIQYAQASLQQSLAAVQASDLAERLWGNLCALDDSATADKVIAEWQAQHAGSMPGWAGNATRISSHRYALQVEWRNPKASVESMSALTGLRHEIELPLAVCNS